jgi:hypothetical protein
MVDEGKTTSPVNCDEITRLAAEIRDLVFEDANPLMQEAMIGSPAECLWFAKRWIQRAKELKPDQDFFVR